MTRPRILLASASPRRKELLSLAGLHFDVIPSRIDESVLPDESPAEHVRRLARDKADRTAAKFPQDWVLSADTVVVLDNLIMGKPKNRDEAVDMLQRLSGSRHRVLTGFCIQNRANDHMFVEHVETEVEFRKLTWEEIDSYIDSGEVWDKAGAYAIQGRGAVLTAEIKGSYTNVIGLPLAEVLDRLRSVGATD